MDVATAWIGNNILSVDFDHFFEYSLDQVNMQYISLLWVHVHRHCFRKSFQQCAVYVHIVGLYT